MQLRAALMLWWYRLRWAGLSPWAWGGEQEGVPGGWWVTRLPPLLPLKAEEGKPSG